MQLKTIVGSLALLGLASHVLAQTAPAAPQKITITGSSIKRIASETSLPIQTITRAELDRQGILSAEQLIADLNINGNGLDNLAGNADVVNGAARGNNGATSANLRGQGSNATLILLNGRRVASHGLNGGQVDLNQIPFSAVERVEILKDGASSIYGTDAVGGVINFILRANYSGLRVAGTADVTQHGGGNIFRTSLVGGIGDIDRDGWNLLGTLMLSDTRRLDGRDRDFVNTFQPERGLSPDTRGTPFATVQMPATNNNTIRTVLTRPGQATLGLGPLYQGVALNGINILDLPGAAGCASQKGMGPYDERIWAAGASAQFGCAYDTGKAGVITQPVKNTNFVTRGTLKLGEHLLAAEAVIGRSESNKVFSENQISSGNATATLTLPNGSTVPSPFRNLAYPSTGAGYARVFNGLVAAFPELAANNGLPMTFRWRCMTCGPREIATQSDTTRYLLSLEGPLPFASSWDYRFGTSTASSKSKSTLGGGYHYMQKLADLISTGVLNPFLLDGETQSVAALAGLEAASARGVSLYGGKFTMSQTDATVSGPLFRLPAGEALAALGMDMRTEKYKFDGNNDVQTTAANWIFNAPFDNTNALTGVKRDIKAVFGETVLPIVKSLEVTLSVRRDDYTGFGATTNPKVSFKFTPLDSLLARGSYSKGFRVPTFNQLYNGITESPYTGAGVPDPAKCPSLLVNTAAGNPCNAISFNTLFGGKPDLGPERAKLKTLGIVWQPLPEVSANLDWWSVDREGTIQSLAITGNTGLLANYELFKERFIRNANGDIVQIDQRWINAGETETRGLEFGIRAAATLMGAKIRGGLDVSYLLKKRSRLVPGVPFGSSEVGVFSRAGDLGLRWKHTAFVTYERGDWTGTLTQVYRGRYAGYVPPGVANGSYLPAKWDGTVAPYVLHHLTVGYKGIKNLTLTAGIKNLFDTKPPFANWYDTVLGTGSSWEPRVADPRLRSFLFQAEYVFF